MYKSLKPCSVQQHHSSLFIFRGQAPPIVSFLFLSFTWLVRIPSHPKNSKFNKSFIILFVLALALFVNAAPVRNGKGKANDNDKGKGKGKAKSGNGQFLFLGSFYEKHFC